MEKRDLSKVNKIVLHCSGTRIDQDFGAEACRNFHVNDRKWSDIGYHYYIEKDGTLVPGRNIQFVGAHCRGNNTNSIGICLEGGYNENGKPWRMCLPAQLQTLKKLIEVLYVTVPGAALEPHYKYNDKKTCPNFSISDLLRYLDM